MCSNEATCCYGNDMRDRSVYWKYNDQVAPGLADVFCDEHGEVYSILNIKQDQCATCKNETWAKAAWTCTFSEPDGTSSEVPASVFRGGDPHGITLIVTCSIPQSLLEDEHHLRSMSLEGFASYHRASYHNVSFCSYTAGLQIQLDGHRIKPSKFFLVACTQVDQHFAYLLPEWVAYHKRQGFQHFVIYTNAVTRPVRWLMRPFILEGTVSIIDWQFPGQQGKFIHQQAYENTCLRRHAGRSDWVGLMDVDEYFQPVGLHAQHTTAAWLRLRGNSSETNAFQMNTCFWGSSEDVARQQTLDAASPLTLGRYRYRSKEVEKGRRQKVIVRPNKVFYHSVHDVTSGAEMIIPNPDTEIRVAHYKLPSTSIYDTFDMSMAQWAGVVDSDLAALDD